MSSKIDYNHKSFKKLLEENPFKISLPSEGAPIEKYLESYPMFYTLVTNLSNEHYRLSNGLCSESVKRILRLKIEADAYAHILDKKANLTHALLDKTQGYVREMLCSSFKFRNTLVSGNAEKFANSLHSTADTLYSLVETLNEHLPYLEYDPDFHNDLSLALDDVQEALIEVMDYAIGESSKEEEAELEPEAFEIKRDLFVNSLGLKEFNKLPVEKRMSLLESWQNILLRHRLVIGEYFALPFETEDKEALKDAQDLIKDLSNKHTDDGKKVNMLDVIRDIHVSLGVRLQAIKDHCTNTPIPLFLDSYENFFQEVTPLIHRSMN
jgi:hypothetical protein